MKKTIHIWRVIAYISCLAMACLSMVLSLVGPSSNKTSFLEYYFDLALGPIKETILITIGVVMVGLLIYGAFFFFYSAFLTAHDPKYFFSFGFWKKWIPLGIREVVQLVVVAGPAVLTLLFISLAAPHFNRVNAFKLIDMTTLGWDQAFTGTYPFISWLGLEYPDFFVTAVRFSFIQLSVFLVAFSIIVFFFNRLLFEEMSAAFCFNIVIMALLWQLIPVLSPHDRFIDNVYNLPIPENIQLQLSEAATRRHPIIQDFLNSIRLQKNQSLSGVMPTTTFPSAHVAWATFLAYYAYRFRKWFSIIFLPIAVFSTIGTVLLAQHYFVDIPSGILIMAFSIAIVRLVDKKIAVTLSRDKW